MCWGKCRLFLPYCRIVKCHVKFLFIQVNKNNKMHKNRKTPQNHKKHIELVKGKKKTTTQQKHITSIQEVLPDIYLQVLLASESAKINHNSSFVTYCVLQGSLSWSYQDQSMPVTGGQQAGGPPGSQEWEGKRERGREKGAGLREGKKNGAAAMI